MTQLPRLGGVASSGLDRPIDGQLLRGDPEEGVHDRRAAPVDPGYLWQDVRVVCACDPREILGLAFAVRSVSSSRSSSAVLVEVCKRSLHAPRLTAGHGA